MKRALPGILISLFLLNNIVAQSTSIYIWNSLLTTIDLTIDDLQENCPNFPNINNYQDDELFTKAIENWDVNFPEEVEAFYNIEQVKSFNPLKSDLGLTKKDKKPRFENSYWEWIQASGLSVIELNSLVPHFPIPRVTTDKNADKQVYEKALHDWMILFPKEFAILYNDDRLVAQNPHYVPIDIESRPLINENPRAIEITKEFPVFQDFDSGNPLLDQARYQAAIKHWYYEYEPGIYLEKYPEKTNEKGGLKGK